MRREGRFVKENGCRFRFNPGRCDFFGGIFFGGVRSRIDYGEIPAFAGMTFGATGLAPFRGDADAPSYFAAVTADAPRTFFATYSANPLA